MYHIFTFTNVFCPEMPRTLVPSCENMSCTPLLVSTPSISLAISPANSTATIYFRNVKRHNVISQEMQTYLRMFLSVLEGLARRDKSKLEGIISHESLRDQFEVIIQQMPIVRMLVITTEDPSQTWCSGMDLNQENQKRLKGMLMKGGSNNEVHKLIEEEFLSIFQQLSELEIPTVAFIRGPVLGGGLGFMLSCDYIVADATCLPRIFFQFAEVKRGLVPALISLYIVPRIGVSVSKRLMMSGERVQCEEALRLGVVHESATLEGIVEKYAALFKDAAPGAVSLTKRLVHSYVQQNPNQLNLVLEVFREMMLSEEAKYGISCFLKKQTPDWEEFVLTRSKM